MKQNYFLLLFLLVSTLGYSQTLELSGKISDKNGLPLSGVTIYQTTTNNGVISDFDGNFTIVGFNTGSFLEFSFLGFINKLIIVKDDSFLNIVFCWNMAIIHTMDPCIKIRL